MNKRQKQALAVGAAIALLMGLFPPWTYTLDSQFTTREKPAGYSFIMNPPDPEVKTPEYGVRLDGMRLFVQWVVAAIAAVAAIALLEQSGENHPAVLGDHPRGGGPEQRG